MLKALSVVQAAAVSGATIDVYSANRISGNPSSGTALPDGDPADYTFTADASGIAVIDVLPGSLYWATTVQGGVREWWPIDTSITAPTWSAAVTYQYGALVAGSNGLPYISISSSNAGFDPVSSPGQWQVIHSSPALVFNVKDFGAVGDGVTDDTDAIRAASNAMQALSGTPILYFPSPGAYVIKRTIWIPPGCIVQGTGAVDGQNCCILSSVTDAHTLELNGYSQVRDITIIQVSGATKAIWLGSDHNRISRCVFSGAWLQCIVADTTFGNHNVVDDCVFSEIAGGTIGTGGAIISAASSNYWTIRGNVFQDATNDCIDIGSGGSVGHIVVQNRVVNPFGGPPAYGLVIVAGASDKLIVSDNDFSLATTPISNGSTGSNNKIHHNVGVADTGGGGGAASPMTLTSSGPSEIPLTIVPDAGQTGHMLDIGAAGALLSVNSQGDLHAAGSLRGSIADLSGGVVYSRTSGVQLVDYGTECANFTEVDAVLHGHLHLSNVGNNAPTIAPGAQATAATIVSGSGDASGNLTFTAAAVPAAGDVATVTFGNWAATAPRVVLLQLQSTDPVSLAVTAFNSGGFTVTLTGSPLPPGGAVVTVSWLAIL